MGSRLRGGELFSTWGKRPAAADFRRCGSALAVRRYVPRPFTLCIRSHRFSGVLSVVVREIADALLTVSQEA